MTVAASIPKKILIALDGSEQAREAVRYAAGILPSDQTSIVLYHVLTKIPDSFWDLHREHAFRHKEIGKIQTWELHQENLIKTFMAQARQTFLDSGFPEDAVTVKIHERERGIARDIIAESLDDYRAVVVGRKGLSELKDLMMGSVATKLVEKLSHIPVWVVGGSPRPGKILIGMDASDGAMWAVDHVANLLDGTESRVTLFHAIRNVSIFSGIQDTSFVMTEEKEWISLADEKLEHALEIIDPVFDEAKTRLIQGGLPPDRIDGKIVKGVRSRAGAIVAEAEREGYGTIVLGRRGLSKVQDFFMGRVSSKVIQMAGHMAVWVVS